MPRVVFFHAYPHQYAGVQRLTHMLARDLPERGWDTVVVTPDEGPFVERLRADDVSVEVVPAPRVWTRYGGALESGLAPATAAATLPVYWLRLARALRRLSATVVQCNDHRGVLLGGPAARLAGRPVVWHVHGVYGSRAINWLGGAVASQIVVLSRATLRSLPVVPDRYPHKTRIVYDGISEPSVPEDAAQPALKGAPLILTGARIHPEKGLDVLIRAAARLRERVPGVRVCIAGNVQEGYEEHFRELESLRDSLGVGDTVQFLGHVEETTPLWASADVYVQPSREEPFGLGVLEAMFLGVPVVTTRVGGLTELVEDGVTGVQVDRDDDRALADAIARMLHDREFAAALATRAQERARTCYTKERMVDELLDVYERAAGSRT